MALAQLQKIISGIAIALRNSKELDVKAAIQKVYNIFKFVKPIIVGNYNIMFQVHDNSELKSHKYVIGLDNVDTDNLTDVTSSKQSSESIGLIFFISGFALLILGIGALLILRRQYIRKEDSITESNRPYIPVQTDTL